MKKRITIEIKEDLLENMERFKPFLNYSAIIVTAIKREIDRAKKIEAQMAMEDKAKEGG